MESNQSEDIPAIKAVPSTIDELSWVDFQRSEVQGTLKRVEETAKYLSGLTSICLTILLGPNKDIFKSLQHINLLRAGIVSWAGAILISLFVLFPFRYKYINNSFPSIWETYKKITRRKYFLLVASATLFLIGIALFVFLFLIDSVL